jgi:hypothetical protein
MAISSTTLELMSGLLPVFLDKLLLDSQLEALVLSYRDSWVPGLLRLFGGYLLLSLLLTLLQPFGRVLPLIRGLRPVSLYPS